MLKTFQLTKHFAMTVLTRVAQSCVEVTKINKCNVVKDIFYFGVNLGTFETLCEPLREALRDCERL